MSAKVLVICEVLIVSDTEDRDYARIQEELIDSLDEEFETELEDGFEFIQSPLERRRRALDRRTCFHELLRLQREMIVIDHRLARRSRQR
jgi:hypothetical protein